HHCPYLRSFFPHGGRDCRLGDRLEICERRGRAAGGRHNRTGKLHWSDAHVCGHLCDGRCRSGQTRLDQRMANTFWSFRFAPKKLTIGMSQAVLKARLTETIPGSVKRVSHPPTHSSV